MYNVWVMKRPCVPQLPGIGKVPQGRPFANGGIFCSRGPYTAQLLHRKYYERYVIQLIFGCDFEVRFVRVRPRGGELLACINPPGLIQVLTLRLYLGVFAHSQCFPAQDRQSKGLSAGSLNLEWKRRPSQFLSCRGRYKWKKRWR
jgi:hypothetical protein